MVATTEMGAPFYAFLWVDPEGVVAVFETGLVRLTSRGELRWRVDTDRITDYQVEGREVKLVLQDDPPVAIDLATGSTL